MKYILLLISILFLTGCMSLIPDSRKIDWALESGYILAENCPDVCENIPERLPLPHPIVPLFETTDKDGTPVPITPRFMMSIIIQLFGTVEKFQYLTEIYEREYLNSGGKIMPHLTLEELKLRYQERLSTLERVREELVTPGMTTGSTDANPYLTDSASLGDQLTIDQFELLLEMWNEMNRTHLIDLSQRVLEEREKALNQNNE